MPVKRDRFLLVVLSLGLICAGTIAFWPRTGPDGSKWPFGATAVCNNPEETGKPHYSFAAHRNGSCSSWGGVRMYRDGSKPKR